MKTDDIFHELFQQNPQWLEDLTGLSLPPIRSAKSVVFKSIERRCDLLLEPVDPDHDPHFIVEFQLYFDHSIFRRISQETNSLWAELNSPEECRQRAFSPREVRGLVIFGDRDDFPDTAEDFPGVASMFLDELLRSLGTRDPQSPLLAVLSPMVEDKETLESQAATRYHDLRTRVDLREGDRDILLAIYTNLLRQTFRTKTENELHQMINELVPLKETRSGADLFEEGVNLGRNEGRTEGRNEGRQDAVTALAKRGISAGEIAEMLGFPIEEVQRYLGL